jgi:hypothetical protein
MLLKEVVALVVGSLCIILAMRPYLTIEAILTLLVGSQAPMLKPVLQAQFMYMMVKGHIGELISLL